MLCLSLLPPHQTECVALRAVLQVESEKVWVPTEFGLGAVLQVES